MGDTFERLGPLAALLKKNKDFIFLEFQVVRKHKSTYVIDINT